MNSSITKLLIASQDVTFKKSFISVIEEEKSIHISRSGNKIFDVIQKIKEFQPDLLLIYYSSFSDNDKLLITCINDKYPDLPFIVCSSSFDKRHVVFCLQNGAKGILSYNATSFEIINAIYVVSSGGSFFSKPASKLLDDIFNKIQTTKRYSGADKISKRELEIIGLFAEGLTYKEIANKLNISPRTVETHKNNILAKLNIATTTDLVKFAIKNNLISI